MELRDLEYFVAVAEELSFTKAANRCLIGRSALSVSVRGLERELGVRLFDRTTRRVELTDSAHALLPAAKRTLDAADAARAAVADVTSLVRGTLRVGAVQTPQDFDVAALIAVFQSLHPGVNIEYFRNHSSALINAVSQGRLDIAVIAYPPQPLDALDLTPLFTRGYVLVCRPDHLLATRGEVTLDELEHERFISSPHGTGTGDMVQRIVSLSGEGGSVPLTAEDPASILEFVSQGLGVTVLPEGYLTAAYAHLRQVKLKGHKTSWTLGLVTRDERATSAASAFRSLVTNRDDQHHNPDTALAG